MTENSTKKTHQLKIFRQMIVINLCIKQYTYSRCWQIPVSEAYSRRCVQDSQYFEELTWQQRESQGVNIV